MNNFNYQSYCSSELIHDPKAQQQLYSSCHSFGKSETQMNLSIQNPFFNDPLVNSVLNKYKNVKDPNGTKPSYSHQPTQESYHTPSTPTEKQSFTYLQSPSLGYIQCSDIFLSGIKESDRRIEVTEELNKEISKLNGQIKDFTLQNDQLTERVKIQVGQIEADKQKMDKYEHAILTLHQSVKELEHKVAQSQNTKNPVDYQVERVYEEIDNLNRKHLLEKTAILEENEALKTQIQSLLKERITFQNLISGGSNQKDSGKLLLQIAELEQKVQSFEEIRTQHEQLNQENFILKEELIKRMQSNSNQREGTTNLSQEIEQKDKVIDELQKGILTIHKELEKEKSFKKQKTVEEEEFEDSLKEKIIEQQELIMEHEEKIEELLQNRDDLEEKQKATEEQLNQKLKELEEYIEANSALKEENLILKITVSCRDKDYDNVVKKLSSCGSTPKKDSQLENSFNGLGNENDDGEEEEDEN